MILGRGQGWLDELTDEQIEQQLNETLKSVYVPELDWRNRC